MKERFGARAEEKFYFPAPTVVSGLIRRSRSLKSAVAQLILSHCPKTARSSRGGWVLVVDWVSETSTRGSNLMK